MKTVYLIFAFLFSSCALLAPSASLHILPVPGNYKLNASDSTSTLLQIYSSGHVEFRLNGSNTVNLRPGDNAFLAVGVSPDWYYLDIVGADTRIRNVPVYMKGGTVESFDVGANHLDINRRTFFDSYQEKSTLYPFDPALSMSCYGCEYQPIIRFDGVETAIRKPWMTVTPGWHTIEIYSPLDHIQLYYRTLFDNYTVTYFEIYPVSMF